MSRRNLVVSRQHHRFLFVAPLWLLPFLLPALMVWAVYALFAWTVRASVAVLVWMVTTIAKGQADLRSVMPERRHRG